MDQNEIDALMNQMPDPDDEGGGQNQGDAANQPPDESNDNAADAGELTQADIDAALAGLGQSPSSAPAPEPEAAGDDLGFSQDDIDALLRGAGAAAGDAAAQTPELPPQPAPKPAPPTPSVGLDSEGRPLDELGAAMAAAIAEEQAAAAASAPQTPDLPVAEPDLPEFDLEEIASQVNQPISLLHDVQLHVKIELGRTHMFVEDVLRLGEGSVVELDRLAGDPVDVYVNGRLVARGEVLVLNDNFCVRVSEIIADPQSRLAG